MSYLSPISRLSDALANLERLTEWIERGPRTTVGDDVRGRIRGLEKRIEQLALEFQNEALERRSERVCDISSRQASLRRVS
jgi:hypothetical protein